MFAQKNNSATMNEIYLFLFVESEDMMGDFRKNVSRKEKIITRKWRDLDKMIKTKQINV